MHDEYREGVIQKEKTLQFPRLELQKGSPPRSKLFNQVVKSFPSYKGSRFMMQNADIFCRMGIYGMWNLLWGVGWGREGSICPIDNAVPNLPCQLIEHILPSPLAILSSFIFFLQFVLSDIFSCICTTFSRAVRWPSILKPGPQQINQNLYEKRIC